MAPARIAQDERLVFRSDTAVQIGGISFDIDWPSLMFEGVPTRRRFPLLKTRGMVETYGRLFRNRSVDTMLELGIHKGGSCAFFSALLEPRLHLAVDLDPQPRPALDDLAADLASRGRTLAVATGVNQTDGVELVRLIARHAASRSDGAGLDLVVDDASHRYEETKRSFNILFPRLKPGGIYIVEDWGWGHWKNGIALGNPVLDPDEFPGCLLSNLVFEMTMLCATRCDIVSDVQVTPDLAWATRGRGPLPDPFDLSSCLHLRKGSRFERL